jgi:hypothetical protein
MPYINSKDGRREALAEGDTARTAGELNFQLFHYIKYSKTYNYPIMRDYIKEKVDNFLGESPNYQRWNDMTGCLIRCKKEIHRRLGVDVYWMNDLMESYDQTINEYEDLKISENGDVEV